MSVNKSNFSLCSNIDFKQNNVSLKNKYEDLIYYTNNQMFHEEYGTIDDYSLDSYEPSKINKGNNIQTQIDLGPIGPIGPIDPRPPFTPVTPENPLPTIYNGALQVPYFNQKNFVKNYYENLTLNFPTNNVGNCGYTAISLLLQYYDAYWNSNFIDNKYNVNECVLDSTSDELFESPGIKDIYYPLWTSENPRVPTTDPNYEEKKQQQQGNIL